jgi:hypothetical protein
MLPSIIGRTFFPVRPHVHALAVLLGAATVTFEPAKASSNNSSAQGTIVVYKTVPAIVLYKTVSATSKNGGTNTASSSSGIAVRALVIFLSRF